MAKALRAKFSGIYVTGESVSIPPKFPCVCFQEDDNYLSQADMDTSPNERMVILRYRIDVYSNKASGKKSEVKEILSEIQQILYRKNFTRFSHNPLKDLGDKIFHMVETYRVKYDGKAFYRV